MFSDAYMLLSNQARNIVQLSNKTIFSSYVKDLKYGTYPFIEIPIPTFSVSNKK